MKTQLKNELIQLFSSYQDIEKVVLFGSRAREDHDERSDVERHRIFPAVIGSNLVWR